MLREGELFETGTSATESDSEPFSLASRLILSLLILLDLHMLITPKNLT